MPLFFIAVLPPEPLREKIRVLKEEIKGKNGSKRALRLPAHITLQAPFEIEESLLPVLTNDLIEYAKAQSSFEVYLSGFGAFPPKVLFIEVANPGPLENLQRKLLEDLQKKILPEEKSFRSFHPHITLATRDIPNFQLAWKDFQKRSFSGSFIADSIVLFQHNGKNWDLQKEFVFRK